MTFTTRIKEEVSKLSFNTLSARNELSAFIRYDGKFYNSLETLPKEALEQILYRLQHCTMI